MMICDHCGVDNDTSAVGVNYSGVFAKGEKAGEYRSLQEQPYKLDLCEQCRREFVKEIAAIAAKFKTGAGRTPPPEGAGGAAHIAQHKEPSA